MQCLKCGSENKPDAKFCHRCGNKITATPSAAPFLNHAPVPTPVKASNSKIGVGVAIAAILLIVVGGYWYYHKRAAEKGIAVEKNRAEEARNSARISTTSTKPEVAQAFRRQIQHKNSHTVDSTVVISDYALLTLLVGEHGGGQAVLKFDSSNGWVLLSSSGGAVGLLDLIALGVPQSIAE